jgi:GNAT superfamily N-acetyltransferase
MSRVDNRLVELSAETTSPEYITDPDYFVPYVRDPSKHVFVHRETADGVSGVVELTEVGELGRTDWTVDGFAITGEFGPEAFDGQLSVPVDRLLRETPIEDADFPLSFFKVIAVDPAERSRGIGTQLGATSVAPLFESPPVVVVAWIRENPANRRLVAQHGMNRIAFFEDYFPEDWECPECGFDAECTCDAEMYAWFGDERDATVPSADVEGEPGSDAEAEAEGGAEDGPGIASH